MKRKTPRNERLDVNATLEKYGCLEMVVGRSWRRKLKIEVNPRLGKGRLGQVHLVTCRIQLSNRIFIEGYEHVRETLVHELCHLVAYYSAGEAGHGEVFHRCMRKYWGENHHGKRWMQTKLETQLVAAENGRKEWVKKEQS